MTDHRQVSHKHWRICIELPTSHYGGQGRESRQRFIVRIPPPHLMKTQRQLPCTGELKKVNRKSGTYQSRITDTDYLVN